MAGSLRIATGDFTLPIEAITETFAVLARRGSGKTVLGAVLSEEIIDAGQPVVIVDPLGVHWGLRSSADGTRDGYPVVIFGGEHADVPLDEKSGAAIAETLIAERFPAILDLSLLSKSASRRFMTDFLETLYLKSRHALHLILDEADLWAPQRPQPEGARLLGAMEDIVRRGRSKGLGVTLITQRPAVLSKDVLSQTSVLVAMRLSGKHDVEAIDDWIRLQADPEDAKELKSSLPGLGVGEAWIWSPGWLNTLTRVQIRMRRTFDSSATPKVGETRLVPKKWAHIDLKSITARVAAAEADIKANNPAEMRRQITQLTRDNSALSKRLETVSSGAAPRVETVEVERIVEVPVADQAVLAAARDVLARATAHAEELQSLARNLESAITSSAENPRTPPKAPRRPGRTPGTPSRPATTTAATVRAEVDPSSDVQLKAGARRILETLARNAPMRLTLPQLGTLAKFKIKGGTFNTYWGQLKRAGFIDQRGTGAGADFTLTEEGFAYIGVQPGNPQTTEEIVDSYRTVLKKGARDILDVLIAAWPDEVGRLELADSVEMTATGGTFNTYLGTLRRNGLITTDTGGVRAAEILFP